MPGTIRKKRKRPLSTPSPTTRHKSQNGDDDGDADGASRPRLPLPSPLTPIEGHDNAAAAAAVEENPFEAISSYHGWDGTDSSEKGCGNDVTLDRVLAFVEYTRKQQHQHQHQHQLDKGGGEQQMHNEDLPTTVQNLLQQLSPKRGSHSSAEPLSRSKNDGSENEMDVHLSHDAITTITTNEGTKRRHSTAGSPGMPADPPPASSSLVTETDIGRLLLPWAIKAILHHDYHHHRRRPRQESKSTPNDVGEDDSSTAGHEGGTVALYWMTLQTCLEFFAGKDTAEPSGVLTLGTMHKIVPVALRTALLREVDDGTAASSPTDVPIPILSRDCYCLFLQHFYRPPFDALCDSLLPILAGDGADGDRKDGRNDGEIDETWHRIAVPTLRGMHSGLARANPKRSFQLLVRPRTLLALAKVYRRCGNGTTIGTVRMGGGPDGATVLDELVRLVSDGLFSPDHHMNGYRSLKLGVDAEIMGGTASGDKTISSPKKVTVPPIPPPGSDGVATADPGTPAVLNTETKSQFQCYQEGLLDTIRGFLFPSTTDADADADGDEELFSPEETSQVVEFIPLLLNVFLEQASKMQQQQKQQQHDRRNQKHHKQHSKRNKAVGGNDLSHLQFSFFASVTSLLLRRLREPSIGMDVEESGHQQDDGRTLMRTSILSGVGRNLQCLLEHNVYQPSVDDTKEKTFLELIGRHVANLITNTRSTEDDLNAVSDHEWRKAIVILDALTRLNPTTLRKQLPVLLVGVCTNGTDRTPLSDSPPTADCAPEAATFLSTVISTYSKLRQLDFFYTSFIESVSILCQNKDTDALHRLSAFLDDPIISTEFGRATEGSPIQQLKQVVQSLNGAILEESQRSNDFETDGMQAAISVLTKALAAILQYIRVDGSSSIEVRPMCAEIMNGSVDGLAAAAAVVESSARNGTMTSGALGTKQSCIYLCAWTINLKNRCDFWAEETVPEPVGPADFEVPASILQMLDNAINDDGNNNHREATDCDHDALLDNLKFLACQRINGLYGAIRNKQKISFATDDQDYDFQGEITEVRQLVRFVLRAGQRGNDDSPSRSKLNWAFLAQSIPSWAPYAEQSDIDSFLTSLLQVLVDPDATLQQRRDVLSLLNDASFYEIPTMSRRLGTNVISLVAATLRNALQASVGSSTGRIIDLLCPILDSHWTRISITEQRKICADHSSLNFSWGDIDHVMGGFNRSALILDVFNGIRVPIWEECAEGMNVAESALRIESVCILILDQADGDLNDVAMRMVNSLRVVAARVLSGLTEETFMEWSGRTNESAAFLLAETFKNTTNLLANVQFSIKLQNEVLSSYKMFSWSLLEKLVYDVTHTHEYLTQVLMTACKSDRGKRQIVVQTSYACQLLKAYRSRAECPASHAEFKKVFLIIKKLLWQDAVKQFDHQGSSQMVQTECALFIADMLLASSTIHEEQDEIVLTIESNLVKKMKTCVDQMGTRHDSELRPLAYLISILATVKPTSVGQIGLDLVTAGRKLHSLFVTPLCAVATGMEGEQLIKVFENLTAEHDDTTIEGQLTMARSLILTLKDPAKEEVIGSFTSQLFHMSLKLMAKAQGARVVDDRAVLCASSLIIDLASRKGVFPFRERDIAAVLGCISALMRRVTVDNSKKETVRARMNIFDANFSLLSSILQRFAKQAHSCAPCVVVALNGMLEFSLQCPLPEAKAMVCGQKFSRLCELLLPHGEVYKKHILCLIVRFVDSLGRELESTRKKSLLPAVYCLLDMIQQHEIAQLNSMLDEMGRALLRSVHENYKKVHVYSGQ